MTRALLLSTGLVLAAMAAVQGQQPPTRDPQIRDRQVRDPQNRTTAGTALISGTIVSDETTPQPVRAARVSLTSADFTIVKTAYTDDSGKFSMEGLPANRYTLSATKPGWVRVNYGAKRPDRPGTPITLTGAQKMADVTLRMPRGGVIAGTVIDEHGLPAFGVQVRVLQYRLQQGERALMPVVGGSPFGETTDDRGMYRLYGLAPGEYVVAASPRMTTTGEVRAMTDAEIRAALQALQQPQQSLQPGAGTTGPTPPAEREEGTTVNYAPVFYPGTTLASNAATVTIAPGEERTGVDFQLQLVRTARVEGVISAPAGIPVQSVQLMMTPRGDGVMTIGLGPTMLLRATPSPDGKFSYAAVAPGQYLITARVGAQAGARGAGPARGAFQVTLGDSGERFTMMGPGAGGPSYWAQTDVTVDGQKVTDIALTLQPGMKVSGKIEFRGSHALPPADLSRVRVSMAPAATPGVATVMIGAPAATIDANGSFTIDGVTPGRYRLNASVPVAQGSGPGGRWMLKSAVVKGRDALDFPLEIGPGEDISDAVLTFTDATQEVAGSLQDASGRPAPDYTIVVFAADKQYWTGQSRRIRVTRPGTDGRFTVTGLPPGDYRIAAVIDIAPNEQFDPAFLGELVPASYQISLAEGEKKVQDLKIAG